jgi:hypothetical protein
MAEFCLSLGVIIPPFLVTTIGCHKANELELMFTDIGTSLINHTAQIPAADSECMLLLSYWILQSLWLLGQEDHEANPGVIKSVPMATNYGTALQKATELQASVIKSPKEPMMGPTAMTNESLLLKFLEHQNDLCTKLFEDKIR